MSFQLNPVDGLRNTTTYESIPSSEARARQILQDPIDQVVTKVSSMDDNVNSHTTDNTKHTVYAITTNSGNAYSVTVSNLTSLTDGLQIRVKFNAASSGAITLNVNSLGAKNVVDYFGNAVTNVSANLMANLAYNSTTSNFTLLGKGGGGNATASQLLSGKTASVDSGPITGTMANNTGTNQQAGSIWNSGTTLYFAQLPTGYYDNSSGIKWTDANWIASNIVSPATIFGLAGTATVASLGGKRTATGTTNSASGTSAFYYASGSTGNFYPLTVSGLTFTPSLIFYKYNNAGNECVGVYETTTDSFYTKNIRLSTGYTTGSATGGVVTFKGDVAPASVTGTGFTVPTNAASISCTWIAYE